MSKIRTFRSPGNRQLGGIMDFFRNAPTPVANIPAPQNTPGVDLTKAPDPNNPADPRNQTTQTQFTQNNQTQDPKKGKDEVQSPFTQFADIWKDVKPDNSNVTSAFAGFDPAKVMEAARKQDFTGSISQQDLADITAGGEKAVDAFRRSLNSVAQTVFAQSAVAAVKVTEQGLTHAKTQFDAQVPEMVRRHSTSENLASQNPALNNPALVPMVEALKTAFLQKNPNATSAEIATQVGLFFNAVGEQFAPKPTETAASKSGNKPAKEEDWSAFLQ